MRRYQIIPCHDDSYFIVAYLEDKTVYMINQLYSTVENVKHAIENVYEKEFSDDDIRNNSLLKDSLFIRTRAFGV